MGFGRCSWVRLIGYGRDRTTQRGRFYAVPCAPVRMHTGGAPLSGHRLGERCWPLLAGVWRAIATLVKPVCAEEDVPTAANLNLYRGLHSRDGWYCDDEPLFGRRWVLKAHCFCEFLAALQSSDGGVSRVRMMKATCAGLATVTFLSWMANVRTSFFTVRIRSGTGADQCYVPLDQAAYYFLPIAGWSSVLSANV